jgi:hypothetical protein
MRFPQLKRHNRRASVGLGNVEAKLLDRNRFQSQPIVGSERRAERSAPRTFNFVDSPRGVNSGVMAWRKPVIANVLRPMKPSVADQ